jgi:hypothetical protein
LALDLVVPLLNFFLSSFSVVSIDVAILAHPVGVKLFMGAIPRFLGSSVFVVAIAAHSLGVVVFVGVATIIHLFSN